MTTTTTTGRRGSRKTEEDEGGEGVQRGGSPVTRSRGIVNREACTARLLVTVTVHLHSDLVNNAGIILRGKKKEVRARTLGGRGHEVRRPTPTFSRVYLSARV